MEEKFKAMEQIVTIAESADLDEADLNWLRARLYGDYLKRFKRCRTPTED